MPTAWSAYSVAGAGLYLDQTDRCIGEEHTGCEWIDVAAFEAGGAITEEDFEVGASKGVAGEGHVARDLNEVTDAERDIGNGDGNEVTLVFAETNRNRPCADLHCFVNGSAGLVDSDADGALDRNHAERADCRDQTRRRRRQLR